MDHRGQKPKKLRVAVVFGGKSGEHEVSLISAASVIRHLDRERFEVVPIAIDKQGQWLLNDISLIERALEDKKIRNLPIDAGAVPVVLPPTSGVSGSTSLVATSKTSVSPMTQVGGSIDVVFPVMHGTFCEDGSIQGLLELTGVPYVGCGVLSSAIGMDKDVAKRLAQASGIPIVPYLVARPGQIPSAGQVERELQFPVFVKPANLGSSVGVHKVKTANDLGPALQDALRYDTKVLIEKAVVAREIEFAVLENETEGADALVSLPGEVTPHHEFYSYEAKYLDENGAGLEIPAKLTPELLKQGTELAQKTFKVLECEGMARVDFFLEKSTGKFFLNEINTIPGFTHISMYPKMWEASGVPYKALLSKLVDLACLRHQRKSKLVRNFNP